MSLVHHLADGLIVVPFEGVADVEHALHLADHVFRTDEVLSADLAADFLKPDALAVAQGLDLGVVLLDGRGGALA